jgi:hypothetical protein
MLKTHLQPIVAYFWNLNRPAASRQNSTGDLHSRFVLDYLADRPEPTPSIHFFSRLWQSLFEVNTDPKIAERVDRHGQPYWDVYDPITQQHHRFTKENAVYEWLEQRYYQAPSINNAYAIERGY